MNSQHYQPGQRVSFRQVPHSVEAVDTVIPVHHEQPASGSGLISVAFPVDGEWRLFVIPDGGGRQLLLRVPPDQVAVIP